MLWYGADWLVRGACNIANALKIRPMIIGLTVVSIGTSAPELFVSVFAAFDPNAGSDVALGNVLGSNIANIGLVLGVCAIIANMKIEKSSLYHDIPFVVNDISFS